MDGCVGVWVCGCVGVWKSTVLSDVPVTYSYLFRMYSISLPYIPTKEKEYDYVLCPLSSVLCPLSSVLLLLVLIQFFLILSLILQ